VAKRWSLGTAPWPESQGEDRVTNKLAQSLVTEIRKKFGDESAYMASDIPSRGGITSGSLSLDFAIGPMGGLPRDRVMEFFGPESSGKTTLALLAISEFLDAQPKRGALILDLEHKLDLDRMHKLLGPRMDRVVVTFPDYIEEAQDIYTMPSTVPSGDVCIALLDSIGGAPNKTMTERSAMHTSPEGTVEGMV
jgi:recombination protein RecA